MLSAPVFPVPVLVPTMVNCVRNPVIASNLANQFGMRLGPPKPVIIRQVWAKNLQQEFGLIAQALSLFPIISIDTEFPGAIHPPGLPINQMKPDDKYQLLKKNVDDLKLIQVGLTLSNAHGDLPDFLTRYTYIWEFNFKDFDPCFDPYAQDSIQLLKKQGIDFDRNRQDGIDSCDFASYFKLLCNPYTTWLTFHGSYDFGYLIKILTGKPLPGQLPDFLVLVQKHFRLVLDVKYLIRFGKSLFGGLEKVAESLNVRRVAGSSHQAGSDSLLTLHVFIKLREEIFQYVDLRQFRGVLFGLELK